MPIFLCMLKSFCVHGTYMEPSVRTVFQALICISNVHSLDPAAWVIYFSWNKWIHRKLIERLFIGTKRLIIQCGNLKTCESKINLWNTFFLKCYTWIILIWIILVFSLTVTSLIALNWSDEFTSCCRFRFSKVSHYQWDLYIMDSLACIPGVCILLIHVIGSIFSLD